MKKVTVSKLNIKKILSIICIACLISWVVFRFAAIGAERGRNVFNPSRYDAANGIPVESITVEKHQQVLKEPIAVNNNKAFVSGSRIGRFAAGQKVENGKIVSVSKNLDLDTGMHVIKTKGVSDGLHYAEYQNVGYLVPVYAVKGDKVFVAKDGKAVLQDVTIIRQDADNALITSGLNDGDDVILSKVEDGQKIRLEK